MRTTATGRSDAFDPGRSAAGLGAGLGAKEIYDPGKNLRLDVLGVAFTSRGAEITVEVFTNAALHCPDQLVVVRDAGTDQVLAHKYFEPKGYFFGGFIKSGVIPCRETGVLVLPNASTGQSVIFEMYPGGTSIEEAEAREAPYAASQSFRLEGLRTRAEDDQDAPGPVEEQIQSALSGTVGPVLRYAAVGLGLYVAWQQRTAISNAIGNLLESE